MGILRSTDHYYCYEEIKIKHNKLKSNPVHVKTFGSYF